jgi:protein-S-isoprenylcysteine O-methyltransferase Ste14
MRELFWVRPVGEPALVAMVAGGALFFALLIRTSLRAAPSEEGARKSSVSRLGIFVQMLAFAVTGVGPVHPILPAMGSTSLAETAAVALLMAGAVALFAAAIRAMGANWSLAARTRADHDLVTHGIFARLRHPIYTGMGLFLAAEAIALGHEGNFLLGLPLFVAGTWIRIREEERLLREQFGAAYGLYADRVRRFIPGLF